MSIIRIATRYGALPVTSDAFYLSTFSATYDGSQADSVRVPEALLALC